MFILFTFILLKLINPNNKIKMSLKLNNKSFTFLSNPNPNSGKKTKTSGLFTPLNKTEVLKAQLFTNAPSLFINVLKSFLSKNVNFKIVNLSVI